MSAIKKCEVYMIDNVVWGVSDMEMEHSITAAYPKVSATVELLWDYARGFPKFTAIGELMDDLRQRLSGFQPPVEQTKTPTVKNVIFNNPATIIMWEDGTKSVVKCQNGEPFDPEKGFVMAYLKKMLGNDNTFNKEISKWVVVEDVPDVPDVPDNRPLTTEELMKMNGQKVWCSSLLEECQETFDDIYCGWHIVNVNDNRLYDAHGNSYRIDCNNGEYGFRAYLKPPKK